MTRPRNLAKLFLDVTHGAVLYTEPRTLTRTRLACPMARWPWYARSAVAAKAISMVDGRLFVSTKSQGDLRRDGIVGGCEMVDPVLAGDRVGTGRALVTPR